MKEINLNSIVFDKRITIESLFKMLSQEEIFSFYIGEDIRNSGLVSSPFRDDKVPSFSVYYHRDQQNVLMFHDFSTKDTGDFVVLVMKLYGLDYLNALLKVAFDFQLSGYDVSANKVKMANMVRIREQKPVIIGINKCEWLVQDKDFWSSFGIKKSTLEKYNVVPIKYVFYNGNPVPCDPLAYAYREYKDSELSYKIYQPKSKNKKFKWINNANHSVHQGYTQLPKTGDLLIITKSLKDVMSIHDVAGIPAVGLQSESVTVKNSVMDEYKSRFKRVICLFDNDKAGVELTEKFVKLYDVSYILIPKQKGVTDFSDLVNVTNKENANKILNNLIKENGEW